MLGTIHGVGAVQAMHHDVEINVTPTLPLSLLRCASTNLPNMLLAICLSLMKLFAQLRQLQK
jgi:hypothetical protein